MGIPCSLDPLGSGYREAYTPNQVLVDIKNPQSAEQQWAYFDLPDATSRIGLNLIGGGNTSQWCYIGCYHAGGAGYFAGYLIFNTRCRLRVGVGLNQQPSLLQVATWEDANTWYDLVICDPGGNANASNGGGGGVIVNTDSTFNTWEGVYTAKGNGGSQNGYGSSALPPYGSGNVNGYGVVSYIGRR